MFLLCLIKITLISLYRNFIVHHIAKLCKKFAELDEVGHASLLRDWFFALPVYHFFAKKCEPFHDLKKFKWERVTPSIGLEQITCKARKVDR